VLIALKQYHAEIRRAKVAKVKAHPAERGIIEIAGAVEVSPATAPDAVAVPIVTQSLSRPIAWVSVKYINPINAV
jgi:hypothetical protein